MKTSRSARPVSPPTTLAKPAPKRDDEVTALLRRAEDGDATALPAVRELLKEQWAVDRLGGDLVRDRGLEAFAVARPVVDEPRLVRWVVGTDGQNAGFEGLGLAVSHQLLEIREALLVQAQGFAHLEYAVPGERSLAGQDIMDHSL